MSFAPSALLERAGRGLRGYTGRSARQLLISKLPGARRLAFSEPLELELEEAQAMLAARDLTDPAAGPHAFQLLIDQAAHSLSARWGVPHSFLRPNPVVDVGENYGRLGFDTAAILRDRRYSYRLSQNLMLRTHLSSAAPQLLQGLAAQVPAEDFDTLFVIPGLAYRRDTVDRFHGATFHQADLWRISRTQRFSREDLQQLIETLMASLFPGMQWRSTPTKHPYTRFGRQVDVLYQGQWVEVGEGGVVAPSLLEGEGLDPRQWAGVMFGFGVDRALMLRKGMTDIRLLRVQDDRVQVQLFDLDPWQEPAVTPGITRELSLQLSHAQDEDTLGDQVRHALGEQAQYLQELEILERHSNRHGVHMRVRALFQIPLQEINERQIDSLCERLVLGLQGSPRP